MAFLDTTKHALKHEACIEAACGIGVMWCGLARCDMMWCDVTYRDLCAKCMMMHNVPSGPGNSTPWN